MTSERVAEFKQRMVLLRQLRERTGAPVAACDLALKACNGDLDAAAVHPPLLATRGVDTGDPRHRCRDDCPPWPSTLRGTDARGHWCNTHCARHPDPRVHSWDLVKELIDANEDTIEGALRICEWDATRAVQFLRQAGAPRV